ncbi:hypothetical protein [Leptothoe sp. PORK10 BA2]|uniref:hypothetical protein n=1 Tax=Leptothoe sp. PORK10 BA2 TaxID=3110254 RepID=UPI002B200A5C|nr:hypothetical protein [Leptothoe sp. PORK10 BA2]MEA5463008.1 hypothetical protein [Leptothoe sp. PORK10 BA2]
MGIVTNAAHQIGAATIVSGILLALVSPTAQAACLASGCSQNGLLFSEASSNFKITDVKGSGTSQDPFVVYQDVWGLDISLAISGLTTAKHHSIFNRPGFAINIVSRNLTGAFWRFYDHELQETPGYASGENDGLSFAQGISPVRPYRSDRYTRADEVTDVRDFINFYEGAGVNPGENVWFNYFITDTIPNDRFFIRQRPDFRTSATPTATAPQPVSTAPRIVQRPIPVTPATPTVPPVIQAPVTNGPVANPVVNIPGATVTPPISVMPPAVIAPTPPQSIPEPRMSIMGAIAILLNRSKKHHGQHTRPNQS